MRIFLLCLTFLVSIPGFASSTNQGERNKWYIDLGGKTVDVLGSTNSLTGIRAGAILPSNVYIGAAAFTLTKQSETTENYTYKKQESYSFVGVHVEYSYALNERFTVNPGLLAGVAMGRYEEKQGDTYGSVDNAYFNIEPSIALSVRLIQRMWLNLGVSYILVDSDMGIETGPSLNIFARYVW